MSSLPKTHRRTALLALISALVAYSGSSVATTLNLPNVPLYLPASVPPLNMIVLGRDHKLYYEAYNDHSDLNDDGVLDFGYKPAQIDYFGYFDSHRCYTYSGGRFDPASITLTKKCSGAWSGDFLNYVTTSRIDALRKVLYGGHRSTDGASLTVLERSFIPQDAHSWGKEYKGVAESGYDISEYTPLSIPAAGTYHLFANTTPLNTTDPLMRVLTNTPVRVWNWLSIERPVAGTQVVTGVNGSGGEIRSDVTPTDYVVRVQVCKAGLEESNCQSYTNGTKKPTGLLQEFGEDDSMYFGLLSGSYAKNTSGGVLRREMGSIKDEINTSGDTSGTQDGTFKNFPGIITSMDRLRTTGFGGSYQYNCGWNAAARVMNEGECQMWGNPVGEMMYETLRYFAGKAAPTPAYSVAFGAGEESELSGGGLPVKTWDNPYAGRPVCSKPFETVISDVNTSYDTDQLPGSAFGSFSNDLPGNLNVSTLGDKIWATEMGGPGKYFIGESGGVSDGAPTVKTVTSFGNIRGLAPEEPTKQGGYYAASVAYHGRTTDLNPAAGEQKVNTFAVALASPLPHIEIPVNGRKITIVPFAKSVGGAFGITATQGAFQPTDQIVDFYVDSLGATSGKFRVNFEDVEEGADHDMDAIVEYNYQVNGDGTVTINLNSEYAAGGIIQHMGYVISGTTEDGIYLGVRDRDTSAGSDPDYFLDSPDVPGALGLTHTHTFTANSTGSASLLKDPLWYAAKWGGFDESFEAPAARDDIPNVAAEWDEDGDGDPDNYFLVTNALKLSQQLRKAFEDILKKTTSSSSASVNSGSISSLTRIYQARFNTGEWTGQLLAYNLDPATGNVGAVQWDASTLIPAASTRNIITTNSTGSAASNWTGTPVPFEWASLDSARQTDLVAQQMVDYIRGDATNEGTAAGKLRVRPKKLGDIISSSPLYVGAPPFRYRDSLESVSYSSFATSNAGRQGMVYAGANDGMLHGFNATTGAETFAFIPSVVIPRLKNLALPSYSHQYYVDGPPSMGDAFFQNVWHTMLVGGLNKGGQEIYALDITDPTVLASAEAQPANVIKWEFTDTDRNSDPAIANGDSDLGLTYSQPTVVRLHNGRWAAVFGNGYNSKAADGSASTTGNAVLYVVDIETGALIQKLDTGFGSAQAPSGATWDNGLSTPALVDLNNDRIVEYAYAGDLYGNMWKFDLSSSDPTQWNVAFSSQPLYQARDAAGNAQPITDRPEVGRGPAGQGMIVLFGTGKYLEPVDKIVATTTANQRVQSFYGIIDKNLGNPADRPADRADLTTQSIIAETTFDPDGSAGSAPLVNVRATTNNEIGSKLGWYIDLLSPVKGYQAEKQVSNPIVRNGNVIFTTLIPDADPCNFGGGSWIMEMSMLDGKRLEVTPFDLNNDGKFDANDNIAVTLADGTTIYVPASGVGSTEGILQSPGVADGTMQQPTGPGTPVQYKYLPGSSGNIQRIIENPGKGGVGRQSWRQIR